jgi:hypothetical protein
MIWKLISTGIVLRSDKPGRDPESCIENEEISFMKRKLSIVGVMLILIASACAPKAAAPTVSSLDIQHTAEAAAFTVVAQTLEAQPTNTNTPLAPTATVTDTPFPTLTPIPQLTVDSSLPSLTPLAALTAGSALPTAAGLPTIAATTTVISFPTAIPPNSSASTAENCEKPLTSWTGPTATLTILNKTKPQGDVVLSLHVVSPRGDCGYLTDFSRGPIGAYSAGAFVNGQKNFKVFGSFQIDEGNWKIIIQNDKIVAEGS